MPKKSKKKTQVSTNKKETEVNKKAISPLNLILIAIAAIVVIYIIANYFSGNPKTDEEYVFKKQGELTFLNPDGQPITKINIQIANTEFDRQLGLMFRKSMEENQGMLFIFPEARVQSFWMRNTLISLDMIFIDVNKKIITIHKNTKVMSDQSYASTGPAKYVLEVDAGFADKNNIKVGDTIEWTSINTN